MSSVKPSSEGIQKVKLLMAEMIRPDKPDQKGWTQANLAERSGADLSTVKRFLKGESVKFDSLVWITGAVGLKPEDVIDAPLNETEANIVNWIAICGEMLAKQKEARQLRKEATAIGAEVNVYVTLDLLEHKEQTRSKQEKADSDQCNQYQERKVVKTYEHNDFLRSLTDRQSKNKHIAIVGEAGAGKTTLLARIADELDKNQKLQIFVSLADLRERSLEEHIYVNWLSKALGVHKDSINEEQKNDLFQQFQSGEIWLLLDGLDEMRAKSSADALEKINREIKEVIGQSQVVLTSRLNVWDAYLNGLSGFDTFRMGDFSPEQVDQFIGDWFVKARKPESAPILQAKLKEPNRDRIRDMVRNPLRLALLCQAFYRDLNTELPETKAGLYELFVRYFYEWKPNIVDEDLTQDTLREELHLALGKLAIAGIDGDAGFRLSRSLAVKEMGDRLFKLASDVGWLTLIERDEQDQEVYAFYHASFQEYFAALAIDDWYFFLPREHINKPVQDKKYRIFEPQWRECFFLWIGQEKSVSKVSKEEFIGFLWNFKDNCGRFYSRRAKCLAVAATGEFKNCDSLLSQKIIEQTLIAAFSKQNHFNFFPSAVERHIRSSLLKADPVKVLRAAEHIININRELVSATNEFMKNFNQFWLSEKENTDLLLAHEILGESFQYNTYRINPEYGISFSEEYWEDYYAEQKAEMMLAEQDEMITNNAKDVEDLIDIFYANPRVLHETSLVIDKIIRDYPNSDCGIKFIINVLSVQEYGLYQGQPHSLNCERTHVSQFISEFSQKLSYALVAQFGKHIDSELNWEEPKQFNEYFEFYEILWNCANSLKYFDFYTAWQQPNKVVHPEVIDFIPASNTDSLRILESQFIDHDLVQNQLDRNADHPEIRCLVVDIRYLEQESDPNVIAKKLTNKIFNSIGRRIPVVQDISCLKRELLNLKFDLGVEKLAIALYGKSANEAIHQLCQSLTESIPIRPFTGEKSTQELVTQINAWLSEM